MSAPSIRFLIPYFGKWPAWMPFFVESCRWNPTIEWFFYTDCGPIPNCPDNIRVRMMSFDQYCNHVSSVLGIKFRPDSPYKLCDLKPAYGYIHQDDLDGVDFWAFGDIDVVYGDLRAYFTEERLSKKDIFSTHSRRISGHLCLVRNTPEFNSAFKKIPNWQELYSANEHFAADEGAFSRLFLRHKNLPEALAHVLSLTYRFYRRAEFVESFSTPDGNVPWIDGGFNFPGKWRWRQGKLQTAENPKRCFPYLHFFVWKRQWGVGGEKGLHTASLASLDAGFEIHKDGFHAITS